MGQESTMNNATSAAYQLLRFGKLIDINDRIKRIENVSKLSIEKISKKILSSNPTISSIGPIKELENLDKIKSRIN